MNALLGLSLWFALVTVVPGLVAVTVIGGAFVIQDPGKLASLGGWLAALGPGLQTAVAITVMVLVQAVGILLEEVLIRLRSFGPEEWAVRQSGPEGETVVLHPYREYEGMYLLLARLGDHEDAQGHLKRALIQFFLSHNCLVAFGGGLLAALALLFAGEGEPSMSLAFYTAAMALCLLLDLAVARVRFRVMAMALWAARSSMGPPPERRAGRRA